MTQCRFTVLLLLVVFGASCATDENGTAPPAPVATTTPPLAASAPLPDAQALLTRLATQGGCRDSEADMRLTGKDEAGKPIQMEIKIQRLYKDEKVSTLLTVTAPREETEKALLAVERDDAPTEAISWLAGLKKIARFRSGTARDFKGAKIYLQELLGLELKKYRVSNTTRVDENGQSLIKAELQGDRDFELAFPRAVAYFRESAGTSDPEPVRFELFDNQGNQGRVIRVEEVKNIQQHQTITKLVIEDPASGHAVRLEALKVRYDQNLPDATFTEANLTRLITNASRKLIQ